jgi:hypothetical protein
MSVKMTVFWNIVPYDVVEIYQYFTVAYCFYYQGTLMMEAVSTFETLVSFYKTTWFNILDSHFYIYVCFNITSEYHVVCVAQTLVADQISCIC